MLIAGGNVCLTDANAISTADSLLAGIGYIGPASKVMNDKHPQRTQFVNTAATPDKFNNGLLCLKATKRYERGPAIRPGSGRLLSQLYRR